MKLATTAREVEVLDLSSSEEVESCSRDADRKVDQEQLELTRLVSETADLPGGQQQEPAPTKEARAIL